MPGVNASGNQDTTGNAATATTLSSILPYNLGGTGLNSFAKGDILYASGTNTLAKLTKGDEGQTLKMGSNDIPEWGAGQADLSTSVGLGTSVSSGSVIRVGNYSAGINLNFSSNNLHINGNIPTTSGQIIKYDGSNIKWDNPNEITYTVTVSSSKFYLNGVETPSISIQPGFTYTFDQSASSNATHPLRFYTSAGGVGNTNIYSTNVTTGGTAGSSGAYTKITVTNSTTTLLYYGCYAHSGMGGSSFNMISSVSVMGIDSFTSGDMIYATDSKTLTKLGKGTEGQTLKISSGIPAWGTVADVDVSSSTGIGTTATDKVIVGNASEILQLNFSNLNINGTTPNTSGQYLGYNGSSVNWIGAKKVKGLALAGKTYNSINFGTVLSGSPKSFTSSSALLQQFITSYEPPTGWTQVEITFHFTVYNELINTDFDIELKLAGSSLSNSERYKQKFRNVSGNQCVEYTKTFLVQSGDITWNSGKAISLNFTATGSGTYYLFTTSTANYSTSTVQYPIVSIEPTFYAIS